MDDHGPLAVGGGHRRDRGEVDARRDHGRVGHPAEGVVASDDPGARLPPRGELLGRLAADVRAEVLHHRASAGEPQDRVLERLRHEREAEHEVEHVGAGEQLGERLPLGGLAAEKARAELERAVGLRVQGVSVEHDELRVDPAPSERLDVRPRHPGSVHRAVDDSERAARRHSGPAGRSRGNPGFPRVEWTIRTGRSRRTTGEDTARRSRSGVRHRSPSGES